MRIALGMKDSVDGRLADLSGLAQKPLSISHVPHKTMMGVDGHSIEAAAATAVSPTWRVVLGFAPRARVILRP
jgi:serine protease inhibitor